MLKPSLILTLLFFTDITHAQRKQVYGFLRDSITHFAIANGTVNNSSINKKVQSNVNGLFTIEVASNDFLFAYATSYKYDTLVYSYINTDTITIYLAPAGTILPTVTVTSKYNKYQLDSIKRRTSFDETRTIKTISSSNTSGFGIGINLDRFFKQKDKHQKSSERTMLMLEKNAYINYRFSPYLVATYTGLKGDKLQAFMNKHTPDYAWLRNHPTNEDVIYYINDKLRSSSKETKY
ncbi:MAG TPA: hypothetical protein VF622_01760 [Segetibacter sp.]|jgi:hypothetical protein